MKMRDADQPKAFECPSSGPQTYCTTESVGSAVDAWTKAERVEGSYPRMFLLLADHQYLLVLVVAVVVVVVVAERPVVPAAAAAVVVVPMSRRR